MKAHKQTVCPNCGMMEPLAHGFDEGEGRYRYANLDRLYAGIGYSRVVHYGLDGAGHGERIDVEDFDARFSEWLEWTVADDDANSESKQAGENCWSTRRRTRFTKRVILDCGCDVTYELARDASAAHVKIDHTFNCCAAHASLTGCCAFDMKGRCYVCEWPISAYAKGYANKLRKRDQTYQAVLMDETERAAA